MTNAKLFSPTVFAALCLLGIYMSASTTQAAPTQFGSNYYEFVSAPTLSWGTANAAASAATFGGVQGHLATVTSAAENSFLDSLAAFTQNGAGAWLGGQVAADGTGSWVVGPETGQVFSHFATPASGAYANWGGIEPNNAPSFAYMNIGASFSGIGNGQWADNNNFQGIPNGLDPLVGYFVEYESPVVSNPVPEPETYAMLLVGLGLMGFVRRRKQAA